MVFRFSQRGFERGKISWKQNNLKPTRNESLITQGENSRFINPRKICFFKGNYLIIHYSNGNFLPWLIVFLLKYWFYVWKVFLFIEEKKVFKVTAFSEWDDERSLSWIHYLLMLFSIYQLRKGTDIKASRFMCLNHNKCLGAIFLLLFFLLMLFLLQQGKS
jgi:hypothetical protein